jgi:hypothetical protein
MTFALEAMLRALHEVDFMLMAGIAAAVQGAVEPLSDVESISMSRGFVSSCSAARKITTSTLRDYLWAWRRRSGKLRLPCHTRRHRR